MSDNRINEEYHYNKFNECRKQNILLITIFDIELDNRKEEIKQYINDILKGKENELSYNRKGYMNNNYPSWKHYKDNSKYFEDSYLYRESYKVYTCGYSIIQLNEVVN